MELRQIRYVLAVAKEGSFTRAAQRLNVSQSAISEQVKLLEGQLGFPLLLRTGARSDCAKWSLAGRLIAKSARPRGEIAMQTSD